jgi:hypothetical protein
MNIKQLRDQKRKIEDHARAKLAEITSDTSSDDAKRIEGEHAALTQELQRLGEQITRAEKEEDKAPKRNKRKAADSKDDDSDNDDDSTDSEDDDDKEEDKKRKRKARNDEAGDTADEERNATILSRSAIIEMSMIQNQARALDLELDLASHISRNEGPDVMRKRLFEKLAERSKQNGPTFGTVDVLRDEREGRAEAMEVALVSRVLAARGREGIKYEPKDLAERAKVEQHRAQAQQYMGMGFVEIAAACIGYRSSKLVTAGEAVKIMHRAFESTSDFPNIFQNVLNKSLLARYELHMPTYRDLATERPFNDFRPHPQIRSGEFPTLQPISETGELKYGSSTDSGENISVSPYGVVFTISRQMLVNDDLGAIDQILGSAGDAVLVFENNTFFTMFNSNPTLNQDSTAVFAAGHGNLAGTGAVPSVTTVGAARQALRGMKSLSGNFLNVPPRIILTGPAQETVADQMVTSITPTLTTSVNPFSGKLRSVSDANLTGNEWYLLAEPGRVPCFVYGFLNGSSGPRVRTFEPFGVQGVKVSLEHDFGTGAIDYRGFYKNPGQ